MGMATGDDGTGLTVGGTDDDLGIELVAAALFLTNGDAVLTHVAPAGFQGLRGQVFQHLQLVVALADEGSEGYGNGQAYHASAWDADTHGVLQNVTAQQHLNPLRATA